ncbi:MAG: nucleoside-diphosphate kinase [Patescibacteria group bacterium]|jgi:nucleoside-diphosphate kinase
MCAVERSMLLVKPDGVAKGLVDRIRELIVAAQLRVVEERRKTITVATATELYREFSHRDYFPELVEFMASAPLHIFIVEGEDAIRKVREIIGKREPASGIRMLWAESIIRNVAHGPHTPAESEEQTRLLMEEGS